MQIDPQFRKTIDYLDLRSIEQSPDVIYIVDRHLILRAFNGAWVEFARQNNGNSVITDYSLGSGIDTAFPTSLKPYLTAAFNGAIEKCRKLDLDYECSSPSTFRRFHQTAYPLTRSAGLVISNHQVESRPHDSSEKRFSASLLDENGIMTQCSNCRKVRAPNDQRSWLWVPEAVEKLFPHTSHAICPRCYDFYYPDMDK